MIILGRALLIKPDKLPERNPLGHLVIPETSTEMLPETGVVVQAGTGCRDVRTGARVIFPRKACSVIVIDNKDMYLTYEYKISYYE